MVSCGSVRIHVLPADIGGCGRYRLIWPGLQVKANAPELEVEIFSPDSEASKIQAILYDDENGLEHVLATGRDCDVAIIQRPLQKLLADVIPHFQARGIKVIVEIDDDFHSIHPQNVAFKASNLGERRNAANLMRACATADRVVCSTPALLARYGCGHGVVIPNYVPESYTKIEKVWHEPNRVGWSGSTATHPNDLQVMGAGIPEAVRAGSDVYIVGTAVGFGRRVGLAPSQIVNVSGWVDIVDYPAQMAEVDVGVVPLELTAFNQAKSWLKGLEFAAVGVPFVASPTDPYIELAQMGIGLLQPDRKKWGRTIKAMIPDREELGAEFRRQVLNHDLTIERQWEQWLKAWTAW